MQRMISARLAALRGALVALILAVGCLAQTAAQAQSLGPLEQYLVLGQEAPWSGAKDGEAYVLGNDSDASALKYIVAGYDTRDEGRRTISVEVELRKAGDGARAGLIYGFVPEPRAYFAFVIEPGRKITLYRRDASGFNAVMSTSGGMVAEGANTLTIVEHGRQIELLVNGTQVGQFGNAAVGHGSAGIAAVGIGSFAFKNYQQSAQ